MSEKKTKVQLQAELDTARKRIAALEKRLSTAKRKPAPREESQAEARWRALIENSADEDIVQAYDLHANCYVVKPVGFENFFRAVESIRHFWFSVVTLPTEV